MNPRIIPTHLLVIVWAVTMLACAGGVQTDASGVDADKATPSADSRAGDAAAPHDGYADTAVDGPADAPEADTASPDGSAVDAQPDDDGGATANSDAPVGDGLADATDADDTTAPALWVGGAANDGTGFKPFSLAAAPIVPGWQGAQHLWISFRVAAGAMPPGAAVPVSVRLFIEGQAAPLAPGSTNIKVVPTPDPELPGLVGYDGIPVVVQCPCHASGQLVRVEVDAQLAAGALHGSAKTTVHWAGPCAGPTPPACAK